MLTTKFEIVVAIVAFILGATGGSKLWAWLKSWFWTEAAALGNKLTGHSGPTGHTGP